jgi:hypothetical protein
MSTAATGINHCDMARGTRLALRIFAHVLITQSYINQVAGVFVARLLILAFLFVPFPSMRRSGAATRGTRASLCTMCGAVMASCATRMAIGMPGTGWTIDGTARANSPTVTVNVFLASGRMILLSAYGREGEGTDNRSG